MATKRWIGGAFAIAQITTITYSAYTSGQTYTVTINGKSISYTATASSLANVVDGLILAWQASLDREFAEILPTNSGSGLVLTGIVAGTPFTVTSTATGGITATITATRAATGPNHFDNAANWLGGVAPVATDDLVFENSIYSVLYNIVDATLYGNITIDSSFIGSIGLPSQNANNYREYRPRFLKLGDGSQTITVIIGLGNGRQAERINLDAGGNNYNVSIYGSQQTGSEGYPIIVKNTGATSTINSYAGRALVDADSSGTLATTRVTPTDGNTGATASLVVSPLVAAGAITISGGSIEVQGASTSINASGGAVASFVLGATCPTITVATGAEIKWRSTAGITTKLNVFNGGKINFSGNGASKAVANCDIYKDGQISDPLGCVTFTNPLAIKGCALADVKLDFGRNRNLQVS